MSTGLRPIRNKLKIIVRVLPPCSIVYYNRYVLLALVEMNHATTFNFLERMLPISVCIACVCVACVCVAFVCVACACVVCVCVLSVCVLCRCQSQCSHYVPGGVRPQEAKGDGRSVCRNLRLPGEVLWSAPGTQVSWGSEVNWEVSRKVAIG